MLATPIRRELCNNAFGIIFDIKKNSWPASIAVDIMDTGDKHSHDGLEDLGHTTEYQLGVRKIFMSQDSKIQPYIGGGISFMYAEHLPVIALSGVAIAMALAEVT